MHSASYSWADISLLSGTCASVIIRASIWLKQLKTILGLLLPSCLMCLESWFGAVTFALAIPTGPASRDGWLGAEAGWPPEQAASSQPWVQPLTKQGVPVNYGSNQGSILKQADSYFLLSVVVLTSNPYAEYTETFSTVFLNCHHHFTMEVAIARWILRILLVLLW